MSEYLEVGSVLFQVGFNAAAQLQNPTPLSLQSCSEGLRRDSDDAKVQRITLNLTTKQMAFLQVGAATDLNRRSGWVSISQQLVSCGLDVVHLLLPELQLSHQTLPAKTQTVSIPSPPAHNRERRSSSTE